ncbi:hypothetical protein T07_1861 [Trichinella nelsoni]|uniref:Uncharacterized protein n=1 Tax=Trichinella nelsoni TaxID=6336 RepID=A0A0V0RWL1_9BILA|nr:hypothetical protein T07_1861 [Trichinella nelsoni]
MQRTQTELTTVFIQTTKWKKNEATVSGYMLEHQRRITVVRWLERILLLVLESCCDESVMVHSELLTNTVFLTCLVIAIMLPGKREPGRKGNRAGGSQAEDTSAQRNPPVDTGASSPSDGCANNSVGVTNEPTRESGSLHINDV